MTHQVATSESCEREFGCDYNLCSLLFGLLEQRYYALGICLGVGYSYHGYNGSHSEIACKCHLWD